MMGIRLIEFLVAGRPAGASDEFTVPEDAGQSGELRYW